MSAKTQPRANPFPGLRPFRGDEHHLFFGREDQTAALLQLLRQKRFLAVVGTSGSGKSSLVQAGMIAELYGGTMTQAGSTWEVILLRPGGSPIENLARALVAADLYDVEDPDTLPRLMATLRRSRFGLVEAIKQSDVIEPGANLLVVVDQFEELFRFRQQGVGSEEAAAAFVNLLLTASQQAECPIYVTLTMRSDYLGDCSEIPGLAEAVNEGEYLIPRLLRDQKRDAIEKPIGVGGAKISPLLVQRLLNDVGDDPDQLPVLQHALMRMWEVWSAGSDHDRQIELGDFEATGGLEDALSNHADEIYAALPDELHRKVCERVFKTLTEKGTDNRGIRRPTRLAQLEAIAGADRVTMTAVLDAYRGSGVTFVMPGIEQDLRDQTVLDLSHESLMRGWQRLRSWVEDEAQSARIFRRLSDTASLWKNGQAGLFRDPDLQIALSWREQQQPSREWAEQYEGQFQRAMDFLDASNADAEAEQQAKEAARQQKLEQAQQLAEARQLQLEQQQRSASKLRKLIAGLAVVAVLAGFACVAALIANNNANRLATIADKEAAKANKNAQKAEAAEQEARAAEEAGRKLLYTTDMRLAPFVWSDDRSTAEQLRSLLAKHNPKRLAPVNNAALRDDEKPDLRGFEWHYYQHLLDNSAAVFSGHGSSVIDGAFTADGQLVTLDQSGQVRRWNIDSQDEIEASRRDLPNGSGAQVRVLSPDGRLAALAAGNKVYVLNATTGKEIAQVESANDPYRRLIFSPDSDRLVIVDDKIRWCDATNGETIAAHDRSFGLRKSLALSADGLTLAVVGHGRGNQFSVFRLDPTAMKLTDLAKVITHFTSVTAAALISDGTSIAAVGFSNQQSEFVTVFDTDTGKEISQHRSAHPSIVSAMALSRDGLKLATADNQGTIKIWEDARTLNSKSTASMTLKGHQGRITSLGFSSDGKQLFSTSADKTARVWDTSNASPAIRPLQKSQDGSSVACISPDGQLIAANDGSSLRLWDAATGQLVRELTGRVSKVAFSPTDSRLLAVGYGGQADISHVSLWDIDAGIELARLPGATDLPDFRIYDDDGTLGHTRTVGALAFSPDGKYLVAGFGSSSPRFLGFPHSLKVWEVATRRLIRRLNGHTGLCTSLDFSTDGTRLASGSKDGTAILWSTDTWQATQTLRNSDPGYIFPSKTGRGMVWDVAFSRDDTTLAMASVEGNVLLWNVATGKLLGTLKGHSSGVGAVVFSPDGRTLASGGSGGDQTVRLWNVETRQELMQLDTGGIKLGNVQSLEFSPDGKQLLAGGGDRTVIWSTAPIVWNDPLRAAAKLRRLLDSNADFQSRIRMFSENLRLHEALEKMDSKDGRVQAALAATRANWHVSQRRWAEAAEEFDRLRKLSPDAPQAWLRTPGLIRVAQALFEQGEPADAATLLTGGVQRRIADCAVVDEQITSLLATIDQRLTENRRHVGLLELRAELAGQLSRWSEQVADYTAAIEALSERPQDEIAKDMTRLYRRRGDAYMALKNWQLAVDDYAHVVTAETKDLELFSKRARAYEELGNWQAAANDWTRAVAANPVRATLQAQFARRLANSGQFELAARERTQARRLYELALQANPDSHLIAEQLAQLRFEMSEPKWTVLKPTEMKSAGGATLTPQKDGSILAGGQNPPSDHYQLVFETDQKTVTAFRLEAMLDESLPGRGPGREAGGNFSVNQMDVEYDTRSPGSEVNPLPLVAAVANRSLPTIPITPHSWNLGGGGSAGDAYFEVSPAVHSDKGLRFTFSMQMQKDPRTLFRGENLGRFRLSISDDAQAFRHARIRLAAMKFTDPWARLAAAYHFVGDEAALEKLLLLHPAAAICIGDLYAAHKDWERAIAEYSKLITPRSTDATVLAQRAAAYVATEQWNLAQADWMRAIQQQSDLAQTAFESMKQAGGWSEAAKFGLMLVEQTPDDSPVWLSVATMLVLAGDEAGYSQFCRRMVEKFGETHDLRDSLYTCRACLLRPGAMDLSRLPGITLAEALDNDTAPDWSLLADCWGTRALLAYRSHDAAFAVMFVSRSEALSRPAIRTLPPLNLAVRALALHQLGQQAEARSVLDEASQLVNQLQQVASTKGHQDLLMAQILLREAETKINGQSAARPAEAAPNRASSAGEIAPKAKQPNSDSRTTPQGDN